MIVTVTPNPSLDLTYALPDGSESDVRRATSLTLEASGKGVNVSRALTRAGLPTLAVLPCGGRTGRHLEELLTQESVPHRTSAQQGPTRVNTTAWSPGGATLKLNAPGEALDAGEQQALLDATAQALTQVMTHGVTSADEVWLAVCGSLPPGPDPELVGDLVRLGRELGARTAVDASGDALRAALEAGADLVAPNRAELAEVEPAVARAGDDLDRLARAARAVATARGTSLLVSLGADGALYVGRDEVVHGWAPPLVPVNTAGAGDALLAGWLSGTGDVGARLTRAVRWGRSACLSATTVDPAPGRGDRAPVTVRTLPVAGRT